MCKQRAKRCEGQVHDRKNIHIPSPFTSDANKITDKSDSSADIISDTSVQSPPPATPVTNIITDNPDTDSEIISDTSPQSRIAASEISVDEVGPFIETDNSPNTNHPPEVGNLPDINDFKTMTPDGQAINLPRRIWNKLDINQAETEQVYNYIRIYGFDEVYSAFMESVKHDRKNLEFVETFCQTRKERSEYLSSDQFKSEKRINLLNEVYGAG